MDEKDGGLKLPLILKKSPITLDQKKLLKWPVIGTEEKEAVMKVLDKGNISSSREVDQFGKEFARYIGVKYAIPKTNGTACLLSAFFALDIKQGDEVIVPTNTYWASAMPAAFLGAKIVFAESEPDNFCIDPEDVRKKITEKTKAIVPVHLYGYPCDMDAIMEMANEHHIAVIEDASHAHGAEYRRKKVGSIGSCAAFSFQGTKLMPAGEAGVFVTNDSEIYERALALGHYEKLHTLIRPKYRKYNRTGFGLKHRLSPLHAAIARVQLKHFPKVNATITRNTQRFRSEIKNISGTGFNIPDIPKHIKPVYFMNQVQYIDGSGIIPKNKMIAAMLSQKVRAGPSRYKLLHKQPYFTEQGYDPKQFQFTDNLVSRLIAFPNFPGEESSELVDQYVKAIKQVASHVRH